MEDGYLRFRYLERVESRIDTEKGSVLLVIEHFCVEFIYVKKVEFRARVSRIFTRELGVGGLCFVPSCDVT